MTRLVPTAILAAAIAGPATSGEIRWPNWEIQVPATVHAYIVAECNEFRGHSGESVSECIRAEEFGFRAVVTMLVDPEIGEKAAERYRACHAGLGKMGGRFHRRKAECVGGLWHFVWRFEKTDRAAAAPDALAVEYAAATHILPTMR